MQTYDLVSKTTEFWGLFATFSSPKHFCPYLRVSSTVAAFAALAWTSVFASSKYFVAPRLKSKRNTSGSGLERSGADMEERVRLDVGPERHGGGEKKNAGRNDATVFYGLMFLIISRKTPLAF